MPETDPELIAEIAQHGPDAGDERGEELLEGEEAFDVGDPNPEDEKEDKDVHEGGVDEKIEETFKKTDGG